MSDRDDEIKMWSGALELALEDLEKSRKEAFELKLLIARNCDSMDATIDDFNIIQECYNIFQSYNESFKYTEDIDDIGTTFTIEEWKGSVVSHGFIDYDGYGKAIKDGKMTKHCFSPSEINEVPADATHIQWCNR